MEEPSSEDPIATPMGPMMVRKGGRLVFESRPSNPFEVSGDQDVDEVPVPVEASSDPTLLTGKKRKNPKTSRLK
ncbi:14122_t:CDS:1, partial [Acaulospora colombiana]